MEIKIRAKNCGTSAECLEVLIPTGKALDCFLDFIKQKDNTGGIAVVFTRYAWDIVEREIGNKCQSSG